MCKKRNPDNGPRPGLNDCLPPHGQKDKQHHPRRGKEGSAKQALHDNLALQSAEVLLLDAQLPVKDHEALEDAERPSCVVRHLGLAVVEALPGQGLATREQQEEEAATPEPGEDQADAEPPQGPRREGLPPSVCAAVGSKATREDDDEAGDGADDSEHGGRADSLEGAVAHAQADKVAVRAVAEQAVNMVGDGLQSGRVGGDVQVGDGLLAEVGRDVKLLLGAGDEE